LGPALASTTQCVDRSQVSAGAPVAACKGKQAGQPAVTSPSRDTNLLSQRLQRGGSISLTQRVSDKLLEKLYFILRVKLSKKNIRRELRV